MHFFVRFQWLYDHFVIISMQKDKTEAGKLILRFEMNTHFKWCWFAKVGFGIVSLFKRIVAIVIEKILIFSRLNSQLVGSSQPFIRHLFFWIFTFNFVLKKKQSGETYTCVCLLLFQKTFNWFHFISLQIVQNILLLPR